MASLTTYRASEGTRQVEIEPTSLKLSWVAARRYVAEDGGLPNHVIWDDKLAKNPEGRPCGGYWAREVLVHPDKGRFFTERQPIIDKGQNLDGKPLLYLAEYIPEVAFKRQEKGERVYLFVDPGISVKNVEETSRSWVIHPETVAVVGPAMQKSGVAGLVDEITRIPMSVSFKPPKDKKRIIWMSEEASVTPIIRYLSGCVNWGCVVNALDKQDSWGGVAMLKPPEVKLGNGFGEDAYLNGGEKHTVAQLHTLLRDRFVDTDNFEQIGRKHSRRSVLELLGMAVSRLRKEDSANN